MTNSVSAETSKTIYTTRAIRACLGGRDGKATAALLIGGAVVAWPIIALAQDASSGSETTFGISSTLSTTDNKFLAADNSGDKEQTTEWTNRFSVDVTEQTKVSRLSFSAASDIAIATGEVDTDGVDLSNHAVQLSYARDSATGGFSATSSFRQTDLVNQTSLLDEETGEVTLEEDPGNRNSFINTLGYTYGEGTPFQLDLRLGYTSIWYEDTISTSYDDSERWTASVAATSRLSSVAYLTSSLSYSLVDIEDDEDTLRETSNATLSLAYDLSPIWTAEGAVGYTQIMQSGADSLEDQNGVNFGLSIDRDLPRGAIGVSYNHRVADLGLRNELFLNGSLAGRDLSLDYRLGLSKLDDGETDMIANVSLTQDLPNGQISFGALHNFATESDGTLSRSTQLSADWDHDFNSLSGVGLSATYSAVEYENSDTSDTRLTSITAQYNHALTQDWQLVGGVRYRREDEQDADVATSNTFFVTASRDITFRRK